MVRPVDLPKPVREHPAHQIGLPCDETPGPGAYVPPDPRDARLGHFPKAARFSKGQLVPEDLRTPTFRTFAMDGPGPQYEVRSKLCDRSAPIRFGSEERFHHAASVKSAGMPGPGSYATYLEWSRGVSFTRSSRMSQHQDETPAPDTYGNPHPPSRHRAVPVFGPKVAPSSQSSTANTVQSSTVNVPYVSREALERAVALTRPPTARPCSFPRAARFRESSTDESFKNVGPGRYSPERGDSVTRRTSAGVRIGTAPQRVAARGSGIDAALGAPSSELSGVKTSFPMARYIRGIPNPADLSLPGPGNVSPNFTVVRPSSAAIVFKSASRMGIADNTTPGPGPAGPCAVTHPDSIAQQKGVAFPGAPRFSYDPRSADTPGPGAYDPAAIRPAHAVPFGSAKREFIAGQASSVAAAGGTATSPTHSVVPSHTVTSGKGTPAWRSGSVLGSLPRASRTASVVSDVTPGVGKYNPRYNVIDRQPRAAVLYLGA